MISLTELTEESQPMDLNPFSVISVCSVREILCLFRHDESPGRRTAATGGPPRP
jgi:hypothetical protein